MQFDKHRILSGDRTLVPALLTGALMGKMENQKKGDVAAAVLMEKIVRDSYGTKSSSEIQPLQWSILRYLGSAPPQRSTMSWIKSFLGLTHAPVIRAINTLVNRGLLEQRANPEDARSKLLVLTDLGVASLKDDPILSIVNRLDTLSEPDRETFKKLLRALAMASDNGGADGD